MTTTAYCYTPLSTTASIRLLCVSQYEGCFLDEVSLDELPPPIFEALSYTWSDPDAGASSGDDSTVAFAIGCSSACLRITKNLNAILENLQSHKCTTVSERKIWIDQICINQNDSEERAQQVSIMHRIYSQAKQTLIWLGRPAKDSEILLEFVKSFEISEMDWGQPFSNEILGDHVKNLRGLFGSSGAENKGTSRENYSREQYTSALIAFLNRKWFTRAWVIQEAALSTSPLIVHGSETFDLRLLDHLIISMAYLEKEETGNMQGSHVLKTRGAHTLRHIQSCRQRLMSSVDSRGSLNFLGFLQKMAFAVDATDARDQVYAFLTFQDREDLHIKADYGLETSAAYAYVAASIMMSTSSLELLGLVRGKLYPSRMPSWAVDWRKSQTTQGSRLDADTSCSFDASRGRKFRAYQPDSPHSSKLRVRGKIIDTVGVVSQLLRTSTTADVTKSILLEDELQCMQLILPSSSNLEGNDKTNFVKRVLATIVTWDYGSGCSEEEKIADLSNALFVYNHHDSLRQLPEYQKNAKYLNSVLRKLSTGAHVAVKKRLFVSEYKNLLGMAPMSTVMGDHLAILHGSKVPIVLRTRYQGHFEVVGQCYHEDCMYGEMVDWEEDDADELILV